MAGFWEGVSLGAIGSPILIEIAKQLGGSVMKRRDERNSETRKLIRSDLQALHDQVAPLVKLALQYFSKTSTAGIGDARELRIGMKAFASRWNIVDAKIRQADDDGLSVAALVGFRQSLTKAIDIQRAAPLQPDHEHVEAIHTGALRITDELARAKYRSV